MRRELGFDNRDRDAARAFHDATKYVGVPGPDGQETFAMGVPPLTEAAIWQEDWGLEPYPYKVYESLPAIALPRDFPSDSVPALDAIAATGASPSERDGEGPGVATLARIGLLSNGLLNRSVQRGQGMAAEFRTAGGTGARYHLEIYFICADLSDLEAGVYQYSSLDHSLRQVRRGDFRGAVVDATGGEPAVREAPVIMAVTSTFWRNAWRYKARAYRHTYWDAGTMLGNALATASAERLATRLVLGYADDAVNRVLDVDGVREATVALCAIGQGAAAPPASPQLPALDHPTRPISQREVEFPMIGMLHRASGLESGAEAEAWRRDPLRRIPSRPSGPLTELSPLPQADLPSLQTQDLIFRRRSTRHYDTDKEISFTSFSTLLELSSRGVATDCTSLDAAPLHDLYLIVNAVEGLAPGLYVHHPHLHAVELLQRGDFRSEAQRVAVDQKYAGDAHVNCYYLTDLTPVLERYGNRGYRLAQLECSLHAGKLHLATHALGLGAVGSTSLDDEVIALFSPHAAGKSYMFVTVFGQRRRRNA